MKRYRVPALLVIVALAVLWREVFQYGVGVMYHQGFMLSQDYVAAAEWFELAADRGYVKANNNLGVMYLAGNGVPQSPAHSARMFRVAANAGLAEAQSNLAILYFQGRGVAKDYAQAFFWLSLAVEGGYAPAKKNLSSLKSGLSASDVAKGERALAQWKADHAN
jgi:TPR repeat protein